MEYSNKQVQDFTSDTCGQHCVFFLYHMSKGYTYENIVKRYCDDLIKNDTRINTNLSNISNLQTYLQTVTLKS